MIIRTVVLWVHVLCGVVCVGVCASFVLAVTALTGERRELYSFAVRVTPQINRLCLPLIIAIPVTGIGNLFFAARARGSVLPAEFIGIIVAKIGLLAVMASALFGASRSALKLEEQSKEFILGEIRVDIRRIITFYGLMVGAGVVALGLGLWLSGT
jgi:hypothetical protein